MTGPLFQGSGNQVPVNKGSVSGGGSEPMLFCAFGDDWQWRNVKLESHPGCFVTNLGYRRSFGRVDAGDQGGGEGKHAPHAFRVPPPPPSERRVTATTLRYTGQLQYVQWLIAVARCQLPRTLLFEFSSSCGSYSKWSLLSNLAQDFFRVI